MQHDAGFKAIMVQGWRNLTFLHFRYPPEEIRRHLPTGLIAETFDGSAWVTITPFLLEVRPAWGPMIPYLSRFPETNCRTYVRTSDGLSGIWFFSLEAPRTLAVLGARAIYGLPYMWSKMHLKMTQNRVNYASRRRWPDRMGRTSIEIVRGAAIAPNPVTDFLAERYRLFSTLRGRLVSAPVDHAPWPIQEAEIVHLDQTLTDAAGLARPAAPPIAHFSPGVVVRIGAPVIT